MKSLFLSFVLFFGLAVHGQETPARTPQEVLRAVAALPVLHDGRVMPLDTFARLHLMQFSGQRTLGDQSALEWMLDVLFDPQRTRDFPIFLINHPGVLEAMGVPTVMEVEGQRPSFRRFSLEHLRPGLAELERLAREAFEIPPDNRDLVDQEVLRVFNNVFTYRELGRVFAHVRPNPTLRLTDPGLRSRLGIAQDQQELMYYELRPLAEELSGRIRTAMRQEADPGLSKAELNFLSQMSEYWMMSQNLPFHVLPAAPHGDPEWLPPFEALYQDLRDVELKRAAANMSEMAMAWRAGDWDRALTAYRNVNDFVQERMKRDRDVRLTLSETRYNRANFYGKARALYLVAFLLATGTLISGKDSLRRLTWLPLAVAMTWHIIGLVWRVYLTARPPVTNLYGTFLFVSLIALLLALMVEWRQKNGLGLFAGSFVALTLLMLADRFGAEGDTLQKVVAVLASNFWLSTHVIAVTIGYAGVWIAGVFGHIWLVMKLCNRPETKLRGVMDALNVSLAFGLTFAFLGTMLGGIWADQSWGRFWGWDPKENGALLIVLWTAAIYHARIAGMIRERGTAAAAALGCVMVMVAWLGVNLLGVGLHSYGFTDAMRNGFFKYVYAEGIFVAVSLIVLRLRDQLTPAQKPAAVPAEATAAEPAAPSPDTLPTSLRLFSGLFTIVGFFGLLAAAWIIIMEGTNADFGAAFARLGISPFLMEAAMIISFGAAFAAGVGLWQQKRWGWMAASFYVFLNFTSKLMGALAVWMERVRLPEQVFADLHGNPAAYILQKLAYLAFWTFLVIFFLRKSVRQRYGVTEQNFTKLLLWTAGAGFILPILMAMMAMMTAIGRG